MQGIHIGVDVASQWLDICQGAEQPVERITNQMASISRWLGTLPTQAFIAMESTGHYHQLLAQLAYDAGHTVYVLNPRDIKHYALGVGRRAKSDVIDARILQRYLRHEVAYLRPWQPMTAAQRAIHSLFNRRSTLVKQRQSMAMTCRGLEPPPKALAAAMTALKALIDELEQRIIACLQENKARHAGYLSILSVPGIGSLTAGYLSNLFDSKSFTRGDQVVSFLGLDLVFQDSGKKQGRRYLSKRGPGEARRLLYNAAMSAARGAFKPMYEHYRVRMPHTRAIVAMMRKLVQLALGLWRSKQPFDMSRYGSPLMRQNA